MPIIVRWLTAAVVTMAVLAISIWVAGAYVVPLWVKPDSDRWAIASSAGVALAALAALWGAAFAQRENTENSDNRSRASTVGAEQDTFSPAAPVQLKARAEGNSRIFQAGRDQTINGR